MQGDTVGYNASFKAETDMKVATVSIGYADGFLRSRGFGQKSLMFGAQHLPIIGKISMDMLVVDISAVPNVTGELARGSFNLLRRPMPLDFPSMNYSQALVIDSPSFDRMLHRTYCEC